MMQIMLLDLRIVFFLINSVIKRFKKVFMSCFIMSCIVVYNTTIIPDILDKKGKRIEIWVVKR